MKFEIIIEKDGDSFHGYIPKIKGLHTCGDTVEETLKNVGDALIGIMLSMIRHGDKLSETK